MKVSDFIVDIDFKQLSLQEDMTNTFITQITRLTPRQATMVIRRLYLSINCLTGFILLKLNNQVNFSHD